MRTPFVGKCYITLWQPYYITAMLDSPDSQSYTAVDIGGIENALFGHSFGALCFFLFALRS